MCSVVIIVSALGGVQATTIMTSVQVQNQIYVSTLIIHDFTHSIVCVFVSISLVLKDQELKITNNGLLNSSIQEEWIIKSF